MSTDTPEPGARPAAREPAAAGAAPRHDEGRLQLIADALPVLISYIDAEGRYRFNNAAYQRWFGITTQAIVGRHMREVLGDEAYRALEGRVMAALAGQPQSFEERVPYRGAGLRDVHVDYVPHRGPEGRVVGFYALIADVTERRRADEAVKESEELTRSILNALTAHIAVLDRTGNIIAVNSAWERFARANGEAGLARSGVGVNYLDVCRRAAADEPDAVKQVLDGLERVLDGTLREFSMEYPCHSPSQQRWFLLHATPLSPERGGAVVSHTSITELKRATEALHESEERFRTFMDNTGAVAWMKDEQGRYVYLNKPFEKRFGVRLEDWRGKDDFEVWPRDVAEGFRRNDDEVLSAGRAVEVVEHTMTPGVCRCTWLTSKFPFQDASGRTYVGGIGIEITERKELEREVLEIAALEQRRIGQELHDSVGQELTGLGLLAATLAEQLTARPAADAALAEKVVRGIERVRRQVRALSHGLVPVEVDPEGLRGALEELADTAGESSGCQCTFECNDPLTVTDQDLATHLFRIAQEAVSNALRHSQARHLRIALRAEPEAIVLTVQDDGVGFAEPLGGIKGLGLRLMRYRAGVIGGTVTVAAAEGGGTIVTCRIPRGSEHAYQHIP